MLVIHPKDRTTAILSTLYEGLAPQVINGFCSTKEISHLLNHVSAHEPIMLLGHGSDKGLFFRHDDTVDGFDKIIVGHPHAYHLRKHRGKIVAVWCNADLFARDEGLHGLFTGMIITEVGEALLYNVETAQEELSSENVKLFKRLRILFDENIPMTEIPKRMQALDDVRTPLTIFNYNNFFYL